LAQLTQQDKYYDAIARITNELEKIQDSTSIPGLWPLRVNARGCTKYPQSRNGSPTRERPAASTTKSLAAKTRRPYAAPTDIESYKNLIARDVEVDAEVDAEETVQLVNGTLETRQQQSMPVGQCNGGLELPISSRDNKFTMGGMADSTYEYLPKEYLLLGGLEQYQKMYTKVSAATRKHLVFQPMVKDGRDIRFTAATSVTPGKGTDIKDLEYEGTHLTCFVGGMFALGAKAFGIEGDLELAAKLTDGCVWAYEVTQTGIMPERFRLLPCQKGSACEWDQAAFDAGTARWSRQDPAAGPQFRNGESTYGERIKMGMIDESREPTGKTIPMAMPGSLNPHDSDIVEKRSVSRGAASSAVSAVSVVSSPTSFPEVADLENRDAPRSSPSSDSPQASTGKDHLPAGMISIPSPKYILRPEAIESVFIMYRLTGDESWRKKGWQMFEAVIKHTRTELAHAGINDVTAQKPTHMDTMESFWLAETLKYFYLLFSDPTVVDLDKYVL
jgi:mannosyl-oligosaccharide alpha-1,2-mannosidase